MTRRGGRAPWWRNADDNPERPDWRERGWRDLLVQWRTHRRACLLAVAVATAVGGLSLLVTAELRHALTTDEVHPILGFAFAVVKRSRNASAFYSSIALLGAVGLTVRVPETVKDFASLLAPRPRAELPAALLWADGLLIGGLAAMGLDGILSSGLGVSVEGPWGSASVAWLPLFAGILLVVVTAACSRAVQLMGRLRGGGAPP